MTKALEKTKNPAEIYEAQFVPALFAPWGPILAEAAGVRRGGRVLDIGCGTGALTRAVVRIAGPEGAVFGLDPNPDMLAVARRVVPEATFQEGLAEAPPFEEGSFDAVVSQFAMMFFENRPKALRAAMRLLKPGGRLAIAVCGDLDRSPGYRDFAALLKQLFGAEIEAAFRQPFVLGDAAALRRICDEAGLSDARVEERMGEVRFASVKDLVATERACVWTLGGLLDEAQFRRLAEAAETALAPHVGADGRIMFDMPALIITAQKA